MTVKANEKGRRMRKGERKSLVCVGIDQSLIGTAVAVLVDGRLHWVHGWTGVKSLQKEFPDLLSFYKIGEQSDAARTERIDHFAHWIADCVVSLLRHPGYRVYVAMEGYAMSQRSNRATDLHELGGLIKNLLWREAIPLRVYNPVDIKIAFTGDGKATKAAMMMACFQYFGQDYTQLRDSGDNLADAQLIAQLLHFEMTARMNRSASLSSLGLPKHVQKMLNKTTKKAAVPVLDRPFSSMLEQSKNKLIWGARPSPMRGVDHE